MSCHQPPVRRKPVGEWICSSCRGVKPAKVGRPSKLGQWGSSFRGGEWVIEYLSHEKDLKDISLFTSVLREVFRSFMMGGVMLDRCVVFHSAL